jgi:hypothetical protein
VPRLSIVIPCTGGAAEFDGTLVSVLQNRPVDCEVLVVHGEPYDDPYSLDSEVRFIRHASGSIVELINAGLEQTAADVVHVISCGLVAQEGWTEPALAHFADEEVAAVSPVVLAADGQRVHAAGVRWAIGGKRKIVSDQRVLLPGAGRLRSRIVGPTLAAGFYRREVLAALGGFDSGLAEPLADVDAALAIRQLGQLHVCEPTSRLALSEAHAERTNCGFTAGRSAERLFWRYAKSRGLAISLGAHALSIITDVLKQAPSLPALTSLLGRAAALCEIGAVQQHQRNLAAASDKLEGVAKLRAVIRMPANASRAAEAAPVRQRRAA